MSTSLIYRYKCVSKIWRSSDSVATAIRQMSKYKETLKRGFVTKRRDQGQTSSAILGGGVQTAKKSQNLGKFYVAKGSNFLTHNFLLFSELKTRYLAIFWGSGGFWLAHNFLQGVGVGLPISGQKLIKETLGITINVENQNLQSQPLPLFKKFQSLPRCL